MGAQLEIVITHYNEDWAVCSKLFKMLDVQRGMGPCGEEARISIVQDGNDSGGVKWAEVMRVYPYISSVTTIPHGGISAARNAGIDAAKAEWILFADCDDMPYSCDSLRTMLGGIADGKGKVDLISGKIVIESRDRDGRWYACPQDLNWIFTHGKIWRAEWLREKRMRFDERLAYGEDTLFCAIAAAELDGERIGRTKDPVWMWCMRQGSCTSNRELDARNRRHLMERRVILPEELEARGMPDKALGHAYRGILDAYWELNGKRRPEPEEAAELIGIIREGLIRKYAARIREIGQEYRIALQAAAIDCAVSHGELDEDGRKPEGAPGIEKWVQQILDGEG